MNKKWIRMIGLCIGFGILLQSTQMVVASTISDIKKQQEEDQKKLNNVQGQISGIQGKKDEVGNEISEIDNNLVEVIASVEIIEEELTEKEEQIVETQAQFEVAKAQEEEQYESMKLRIKFMYEQGEISFLQIFLTSDSFSEMMNKTEYVEQLYAYDRKMLEEYKLAKEKVEELWNQLEDEKAALQAQQHELEEEKKYMEEILDEKKQEFENYNVQLAQAKQEAAAYKTRIKQQTAQIKKLEDEAKKKAEAEAKRKKAEEDARKKSEAAASGGTSDSSSSDSSSGDSTSGSSDNSVSIPSGGSGSGSSIASYACQFVGYPYVSGGTSLTEGADCSGFVWRVFKDKGYSVPRTSWELRNAGTGVDYSQAQPGDIICYAGHVGIYIGGGNIVHASTERTGIKITPATYKAILSVRRVA